MINSRYSVNIEGRPVALFNEKEAAIEWIHEHWWLPILTVYDYEQQELIYTEVRI